MEKLLLSNTIKLAYQKPHLRGELLPIIKKAIDFNTEEEMKAYLKEHPKADPKNHKVIPSDSLSEQEEKALEENTPKSMKEKIKNASKKAKKALAKMFSSTKQEVKDFVSDPEKRKEMCKKGASATGEYLISRVYGKDSETGKRSIKHSAISKMFATEVHHLSDFASGTATLLSGDASEKEKKEAKGKLKHSAWGISIMAGKMLYSGLAASTALSTGGLSAFAGYAGKKFATKMGYHMAVGMMAGPTGANLYSTWSTGAGLGGKITGMLGDDVMGMMGDFVSEGGMTMVASEDGSKNKDKKELERYYSMIEDLKTCKDDEERQNVLLIALLEATNEQLSKGLSDEEMLEIFEATANDDDSKEMPDDVIDTLMKNVGSVLQKDKPKKTAIYEGYEIQF